MFILVKICKYVDFSTNVRKIPILVKIVENSRFLIKIVNKFRFGIKLTKISILVIFFAKNVDFSKKNSEKISIWVKISKYVDIGQNFRKYRIWWKMLKNLKFGQICRKISILV